ncbi:hypothetical protein [Legionella feeleii]|uniref:Uncharacterized protein n=1 Tax=Legionella feeleii TaxID=453 RepID=A0A378IVW3_9GAMM|nr:hypothetical protein [Legionella feeleii]STX39299.1 Uncharacterised protein [Legionella feeleii]
MKKNMLKKSLSLIAGAGFSLLSNMAFAEEIAALNGATKWMNSTLISIALTVLGLQIMYSLWQVNQGHKEWREVAKPIIITALIVSVPAIITVLRAAMQ